jgi:hypothetical protein
MKVYALFFVIVALTLATINPIRATNTELKPEASIYTITQSANIFNKIIFTPIKKSQAFKSTNEKYIYELEYFFSKKGFKASPISYVLFENTENFTIDKDWQLNKPANNLNQDILIIGLVYEEEFNIKNYDKSIKDLKEILVPYINVSTIKSVDSIELRNFTIESGGIPSMKFAEPKDASYIKTFFSDVNFTNKVTPDIKLEKIDMGTGFDPDSEGIITITLKNNSNVGYILSPEQTLQLSFVNDSKFFVNNKWLNQRIVLIKDSGSIKANDQLVFDINVKSTLLPGVTSDDLIFTLKNKVIATSRLDINVKDIGQKVLKIKPSSLGYINVRADASTDSTEIGRATVANLYIYSELKNNYYKINFNGKDGWVSSKYVDILK